jgi:hypothetical protein
MALAYPLKNKKKEVIYFLKQKDCIYEKNCYLR